MDASVTNVCGFAGGAAEQFIGLGLLSDAAVLARSAADLHDAQEAHLVRLRSLDDLRIMR